MGVIMTSVHHHRESTASLARGPRVPIDVVMRHLSDIGALHPHNVAQALRY